MTATLAERSRISSLLGAEAESLLVLRRQTRYEDLTPRVGPGIQAVRIAVNNKRDGGMGLISGRKAFQRGMNEGVNLLNVIQDAYLDDSITVA